MASCIDFEIPLETASALLILWRSKPKQIRITEILPYAGYPYMTEKPAFLQHRTLIGKWTTWRLFGQAVGVPLSLSELAILRNRSYLPQQVALNIQSVGASLS
jgi:hypothetical protein